MDRIYSSKYLLLKMRKLFYFFLIICSTTIAQVELKHECSREGSAHRWLNAQSTLTENQDKLDISYYGIELEIDFDSEIISGSVIIEGSIGMNQPDSFEFDLLNNMVVDSVKYNGQVSTFTHQDDLINIPAPLVTIPEGYDFSVTIFYHGSPEHCGASGFKFDEHLGIDHVWTLSEAYCARSWWPCKDDPSDKADSVDIIVTVPSNPDFIVASNGILQSMTQNENKKIYHWKEIYPITTYLISLAIYPYTVWYDQYISSVSNDTMTIENYVFPDRYEGSYSNYLLTKDMLALFSELFGEYPFINEKYGHADFRWGGGMEHQTLTSMGGYSQNLIAHELGHSWWGNMITCKSFHDIWLNEGFARYCQALWVEHRDGEEAYFNFMNNHSYFGGGTVYVENPSSNSIIFNSSLSYNKASWVLHMLRHIVGDNTFFNILRSYGSNDSLAYNVASTSDFQNVCESVSGLDFDDFFDQWIYGDRHPHYQLSWWHEGEGIYKVNIDQLQSTGYFSMPIDITLSGSQGPLVQDTTIVVNNSGSTQIYEFSGLDFLVESVVLDPEGWILKEISYTTAGINNIIANKISVGKAYPNPFNSGIRMDYYIDPKIGDIDVTIDILDLNGRRIQTLIKNRVPSGFHTVFWTSNNNATGIYFIQLLAGDFISTQKIVHLK